jgi:capsid assembly protease
VKRSYRSPANPGRFSVTVTLIHSGAHKVDGNPYAPLPDPVRARIQAEIDSIRTLFAQTVAAGRGRRLTADAALATEAECYRGTDAVAAGLADEVSDPASAFATFAAAVNGRGATRSARPGRPSQSQLSKESIMKPNATVTTEAPDTDQTEDQAVPAPVEPSPAPGVPSAPAPNEATAAVALVRAEAAELATVGAQAARLGVTIDVVEAVQKGIRPDALRASVLNQLAARSDAAAIAVVPPPKSAAPESPLLAAAKRVASAQKSA